MLRIVVVLMALAGTAEAQIVNVQGQLAKAPEKDGFVFQSEGKLDWRTGNNPLFQVGGVAALLVHDGRFLGLAFVRGEYGESRNVVLSRKTFEHLRGRYTIDCRWKWEAFAQHEFDQFRRLSIRAIAGTGPALQILQEKHVAVLAGAAYLFEFEQLDSRMRMDGTLPIDAGDRTVFHRASFYVTALQKLGPNVALVETGYAQPRIDEPGDFRLLGEMSITTKITKHVALTDSLTLAYDRTPPDGVQRVDTQLTIGVIANF
jgi:hypothetical protein